MLATLSDPLPPMLGYGLFALSLLGWLLHQGQWRRKQAALTTALDHARALADQQLAFHHQRCDELEQTADWLRDEAEQYRRAFEDARQKLIRAEAEERHEVERRQLLKDQHEAELERLEARYGALSRSALAEQGNQQEHRLTQLLHPFHEQLKRLETELKGQQQSQRSSSAALEREVQVLRTASERMREETARLTTVLKGSQSSQGQWGERVLEHLLRASGLRAGADFVLQPVLKTDAGQIQRPDAMVTLSDGRRLFIDAKVSIAAYQRAADATEAASCRKWRKAHARQLRDHAVSLGLRNYPALGQARSIPLVLMFVPLEGALGAAMEERPELMAEALHRDVLLVSPQTLQATLHLAHLLWRRQALADNVVEVADTAGTLLAAVKTLQEDVHQAERRAETALRTLRRIPQAFTDKDGPISMAAQRLQALGVAVEPEPSDARPRQVRDRSQSAGEV